MKSGWRLLSPLTPPVPLIPGAPRRQQGKNQPKQARHSQDGINGSIRPAGIVQQRYPAKGKRHACPKGAFWAAAAIPPNRAAATANPISRKNAAVISKKQYTGTMPESPADRPAASWGRAAGCRSAPAPAPPIAAKGRPATNRRAPTAAGRQTAAGCTVGQTATAAEVLSGEAG